MTHTRRFLKLAAAAVATGTLFSRQAAACDPEAMDAHLSAVCDGALAPARDALQAALAHATPAETMAMQRALSIANATCSSGDPVAGARIAANLARLAGRIEGRAGLGAESLDLLA
ncbi:hypothetical protein [Falsiroseomonas selenitidurans]|uniref:UrcA family protein n=1 Tax=Falsiroseomonas selenitidurans TaxID=2716335 RepID=A0ABX1EEP4_9PROT|nr:hypothetical protein [Falsiroseomonas selenitidurans]NKC34422.1 hypothetical protein [Falsiroseomonas selenitidurans]